MPLVRSRDLRTNIKDYGFERGTVITLEQLLDEFAGIRQNVKELTELMQMCTDQISKFMAIGEGMKQQIETLQRVRDQHDEGSDS